jgi:lipoprotein-anchoring transpeptidase ErfK/SrfK
MGSTLRTLSVVYLLCAMAFGVAIAFDRDPALEQASRVAVARGLDATRAAVIQPATRLARQGTARLMAMLSGEPVLPRRSVAKAGAPHLPRVKLPHPAMPVPGNPELAAPQPVPDATAPDIAVAQDAPPSTAQQPAPVKPQPAPQLALVPPPPASSTAVSPAEIVRVSQRLHDNLTREMLANFALFLYVSKADQGPWAQHMYVFKKDAQGDLAMLYNWPVSTGREKIEIAANGTRQPSYTPKGYYQLDPGRMYTSHFSGQWHEPMPHAMFFNWEKDGLQTGLAIHGAVGLEIAQLGSRASAGCIRIAPDNAALLFKLIRTEYKGSAPRFAYDRRTATMSNDGVLMHDAQGNLKMADGYKVLVFVENYGGENVVAALY